MMKKLSKPHHPNVCSNDFLRLHAIYSTLIKFNQVVRLLGVCTRIRPLMMIIEYMEQGSLKDYLRNSKPSDDGALEIMPWEMTRMAADVASGMIFLGDLGFIHRDLAAR